MWTNGHSQEAVKIGKLLTFDYRLGLHDHHIPTTFYEKVFKYSSIHISEYPEKVLCRSQEWLLDKFYKSTGDPHLCSSLRIPPVGFCLKNEQLTNLQCKCMWRHKIPPETERIVALGNILGHLHLIPANQVLRLLSLPHNLFKSIKVNIILMRRRSLKPSQPASMRFPQDKFLPPSLFLQPGWNVSLYHCKVCCIALLI